MHQCGLQGAIGMDVPLVSLDQSKVLFDSSTIDGGANTFSLSSSQLLCSEAEVSLISLYPYLCIM